MKKHRNIAINVLLMLGITAALLGGCKKEGEQSQKVQIEIMQYKREAADYFEKVEEEFNATHDDIELTILSPNDATTVMRTRFIREDYPDIIGIGGNADYSCYVDTGILADLSDYPGLENIKDSYKQIDEDLETVPKDGIYGVPYAGNAAGILYNKDIFDQYGWEIPNTWDEFMSLCEEIEKQGILPYALGFKEIWTCLAPWNALAVDLAPSDVCRQVNLGETTFSQEYGEVAEKMLELLKYGPDDPFAYNYNDACTTFARGESAMYLIGSYAVPQIQSVNPDINIDSFVMPGSDQTDGNRLNSGVDLQFCVTEACENKEEAYEVLDFLLEDEKVQDYITNQNAIPCKEGDFELSPMLNGMLPYIESGKVGNYHDCFYPPEMAVDAQIQTYLIEKDTDAFLKKFDKDWQRYNRDTIKKVREYEETHKK